MNLTTYKGNFYCYFTYGCMTNQITEVQTPTVFLSTANFCFADAINRLSAYPGISVAINMLPETNVSKKVVSKI